MLVEMFSLLNIVESGKYSRGNSDSKPGFQGPYSAGCCSIVIAHAPVAVIVSSKSAVASSCPTVWRHCSHSDLGRATSSIRPDMIFGKDRPKQTAYLRRTHRR